MVAGTTCAFAFLSGALNSAGPCTAPRIIAATGFARDRRLKDRILVALMFSAGVAVAYALLAGNAALVWKFAKLSRVSYCVVGLTLLAGGIGALRKPHACDISAAPRKAAASAPFVFGALTSCFISPCCSPILLGSVAFNVSADPATRSATIVAFAAGHCVPVVIAALGSSAITKLLSAGALRDATRTLCAALLLAFGTFYEIAA